MTILSELESIGEWKDVLSHLKDELSEISEYVERERAEGRVVYPEPGKVLTALRYSQPGRLSAVITGQDPYHGMKGGIPQAMGLAFSVPSDVRPPPSLKNIHKEIFNSVGIKPSGRGDLTRWAKDEGVLLLNTSLSVVEGLPGSHAKIGWSKITKAILDAANEQQQALAFLAWGKHSHKLSEHLSNSHHKVIKTSHPSPLGATKSGSDFVAFLGSNCFKEANDFLNKSARKVINWSN